VAFLRRLLGGNHDSVSGEATPVDPVEDADPAESDAADREHELDILRAEQERLDELTQRQLRYAHHSWQPPAQGGERRAEDED
jgi:hypothetical protein